MRFPEGTCLEIHISVLLFLVGNGSLEGNLPIVTISLNVCITFLLIMIIYEIQPEKTYTEILLQCIHNSSTYNGNFVKTKVVTIKYIFDTYDTMLYASGHGKTSSTKYLIANSWYSRVTRVVEKHEFYDLPVQDK